MRHRLIAVVLATVLGATPLARELCSASCDDLHDAPASSSQKQHESGHVMADHGTPGHHVSGHEMPGQERHGHQSRGHEMTSSGPSHAAAMFCCDAALAIGQASCAHGTDGQGAPAPAATIVGPPAVVTAVVNVPDVAASAVPASLLSTFRTPIPLALRTPLRV
jgi:hypothetical protein